MPSQAASGVPGRDDVVNPLFTKRRVGALMAVMLWMVLAMAAAAAPEGRIERPPTNAPRSAVATVRIVNPAIVKLGNAGTVRREFTIRATDTKFVDADGRNHAARIVEFP